MDHYFQCFRWCEYGIHIQNRHFITTKSQFSGSPFAISEKGLNEGKHQFSVKLMKKSTKSCSIGILWYDQKIFDTYYTIKWLFHDPLCHTFYEYYFGKIPGFNEHKKGTMTEYQSLSKPIVSESQM